MVNSDDYAGDVSSSEAWAILKADSEAQLVDVRTIAEWNFVGVPDLSALGRDAVFVEWQGFPATGPNPAFVATVTDKLEAAGAGPQTPVLLLCRSGARSRAAAIALTKAGFAKAINIADGFEGDIDEALHRGRKGGWKVAGLPWRQS